MTDLAEHALAGPIERSWVRGSPTTCWSSRSCPPLPPTETRKCWRTLVDSNH